MSNILIDESKTFKRVNTPALIQMEKSECGAASLGIVFGYYKAFVPLEKLRLECGVTRDGSNAYNLVQVAKKYHFYCESYLIEDTQDLKHVKAPFIVHWEFNHFVVVEGIDDKDVYINDPSFGKRKVNISQFDKSFTGVVIALSPNDEFVEIEGENLVYEYLQPEIVKYQSLWKFLVLNGLLLVALGLLIPGLSKIFIDDILLNDNKEWFAYLMVGFLVTMVLRNILTYLQQNYILNFKINFVVEKSSHLLWHLLHLPILFFQQRYIGDICYRSQAYQRISAFLTNNVSSAVVNIFAIFLYMSAILYLSVKIGLLIILASVSIFLTYFYTKDKLKEYSLQYLQLSGTLSGISTNGIQSIEMIKASSEQQRFFNKWASTHAQVISAQQKLYDLNQYTNIIVTSIIGASNVLIVAFGAQAIMKGELTAGTLVALQTLGMSLFEPIMTLFNFSQELEKLKGDFVRVNDLMVYHKEIKVSSSAESRDFVLNKIEFKNTCFGYSEFDPLILTDFSFACVKGEKVSIVGPSGSGKSTVAKLAVNLLKPQSGEVLFNDESVEQISSERFKYHVGYVDQDVLLFEDTLRSNLALYNKGISDEQILKALEDACILSFVKDRGGLDFYVEEGGKNLSLGQRQRIEIARALLFEPTFLVMDEATSYLDPLTESKILQNVYNRGCGLIIITHRLSAIQDSDKILIVKNGTLQGIGKHDALINSNELYSGLFKNE